MKITVKVARAEGFISRYAVETDEGLVLQTRDNLLWCGQAARAKTLGQFRALLAGLRAAGIEVEGSVPDE